MADAARGRADDSNELGGGRGKSRVDVHIIMPPLMPVLPLLVLVPLPPWLPL
jgi:hypothetical protein